MLNNEELVIRSCSLTNMDNQCGTFKFNDEVMNGCIVTCSTDGCNGGDVSMPGSMITILLTSVLPALITRLLNNK